ncbi:Ubiquitin fusion degradation protein 4 [Tilletia horrida]|nr:Ubiquitin fusion degradation protein 4 [Tilletia horrida]
MSNTVSSVSPAQLSVVRRVSPRSPQKPHQDFEQGAGLWEATVEDIGDGNLLRTCFLNLNRYSGSSPAATRSKGKGKGKEVSVGTPGPTRRSSRNVSQPSHYPTLVSKAAQEAAASPSHNRSSKRPAPDADTSAELPSHKRSKPNSSASRRSAGAASVSASSSRMSNKRNSASSASASSSLSSATPSQAKAKGKRRSSRSARHAHTGSDMITPTITSPPSADAVMDDHCGLNLEHAHDDSMDDHPDISDAKGQAKPGSLATTRTETGKGAATDKKSGSSSKADGEDARAAAIPIDDDDDEDEEDDDGDDGFEDENEDDYEEGNDGGADEGAFGMNIRAMAGYMTGLSGRFRALLASLRSRHDPQAQLSALQELSDLLIVSTEDSLAGYFPIDSFVKELIYIMGGPKPVDNGLSSSRSGATASEGAGEARVPVKKEEDEDAAMAAAIAAAAGFDDNGEVMLIACRCLANLMEAMPYAAHSVVTCGAIPVLCSKLIEITFIDLAEQVLQTLEKISVDYPSAIVKEGGLNAMLQFLDFFNIHVQRTAMTTAANCCRKLTTDSFSMVFDIIPIVQQVLGYADQRLVESACKCVVRIIDSYRHQPELLEQLITPELVGPLCELLLAASGGSSQSTASVIIGSNIHTELLKALGSASKASPAVAVTLLDKNIVETLYQLLTGSSPPRDITAEALGVSEATSVPAINIEQTNNDTAVSAAVAVVPDGGSVTVADMAVLQNLAQRPKEQVQDALSLIAELLPPLPRDGIFDPRAYSEKAHRKLLQKEREKERDARRAARAEKRAAGASGSSTSSKSQVVKMDVDGEPDAAEPQPAEMIHNASSSAGSAADKASLATSIASDSNDAILGGSSSLTKAFVPKTERSKSEREVAKDAANNRRIEKLKEHEGPVLRFSQLMLPTLVEVYAASVTLHVRTKALNAILKITSFLETEDLRTILQDVPVANFVADILSSREHASLVLCALQMVELLFVKLPDVYQTVLRREGVMFEVDDIAQKEPTGKGKAPEKVSDKPGTVKSEPIAVALPGAPSSSIGSTSLRLGHPASGSLSESARDSLIVHEPLMAGRSTYNTMINMAATEADDANIWRARILRERFSADASGSDGGKKASQALDDIKKLVKVLSDKENQDVDGIQKVLEDVAALFGKREEPISSFELLKSGLIESLYMFSTGDDYGLEVKTRRKMLMDAFMASNPSETNAASVLVRRLQESLSRLENVEITTALTGASDDVRRSPTSILAKQLRLRLVAEDGSSVPRSCHQVVVTIHAIASFQSLNDYLRPKIAASGSGPGSSTAASSMDAISSAAAAALSGAGDSSSRLSNILAALSAAGGGSDSGLTGVAALRQSLAALSAGMPATPPTNTADKSTSAANERTSGGPAASGSDERTERRRSSRLEMQTSQASGTDASEKQPTTKAEEEDKEATREAGSSALSAGIESDEALARRLVEGLLNERYDEDMFSEEEYEEEVLEDELPNGASTEAGEKAVALKVGSNGNVEAETSTSGTGAEATAASAEASTSESSGRAPRLSYAAAAQKRPSDWHLEFFMDNKPISLKSTIYGAVHAFESGRSTSTSLPNRYIWQNIYTVNYKKVSGPAPSGDANETPEPEEKETVAVPLPDSIPKDAPYATILQLLGVMHDLNGSWRDANQAADENKVLALSESAFINNKLTAKLNRQLEEPMIVASACLPGWCMDLPRQFPFLFPFEARYSYLQSTSFGYARLLTKWQNQHSRSQDSNSRRDDSFGFLGRLQRQKVRISRSRLFESAMKVFELYGHNSSVLEVEYFEEVGTGLGPTLEFYSLVSREFARRDLEIWRDDGHGEAGPKFVSPAGGLFPSPESAPSFETEEGKHKLAIFKTLGQFVAKALLDSRIIDCNFSPVFMKAVLNVKIPTTLSSLRLVDPALARSMDQVLEMDTDTLASMALDFTLPGHAHIELGSDGKNKTVTTENVQEYVNAVIDQTVNRGIQLQVRAFRRGFNTIMPLRSLSSFTADELVMLFGNTEEDWSEATLLASIKPDHGFNSESASFRDLVAIMANFDSRKRREFLQWLTGSPKLPIGGFAGLHPQLTIVKRPHEAPLAPDDYLPSVMTCVNYLKMPGYSSRDKMRRRLETAMSEGSGSFYLS